MTVWFMSSSYGDFHFNSVQLEAAVLIAPPRDAQLDVCFVFVFFKFSSWFNFKLLDFCSGSKIQQN